MIKTAKTILHAATIGLSAFLLFLIQPMIAKIITPVYGGGSNVWLTSLIFFQTALLAGYAASHGAVLRLKPGVQLAIFAFIMIGCAFFLPIIPRAEYADAWPVLGILVVLAGSIGLPYFLLSTTSPMVQHWISRDPGSFKSPYVYYAVSNAGSLLGLLSYPLVLEPNLPLSRQTWLWSLGFTAYIFILLLSAVLNYQNSRKAAGFAPFPEKGQGLFSAPIPLQEKAGWIWKAVVPSAGLLAFTQHLTVDIVNMPLLWVLPLCFYLLSFVITFFFPSVSRPSGLRTLVLLSAVLAMTLVSRGEWNIPFITRVALTCLAFFAICLFFHGNLERQKPAKEHLTVFYLYMSLGGALGGIFSGILAPLIFKGHLEFYLVLLASVMGMAGPLVRESGKSLRLAFYAAMALVLILVATNEELPGRNGIIHKSRSFFGIYNVRDLPEEKGVHAAARLFSMGTTIHGGEVFGPGGELVPGTYYHEKTGAYQVFNKLSGIHRVGITGLGAGSMALFGKPGQSFDFFELDPEVANLARTRFRLLSSSKAKIRVILGDARLSLKKIPDHTYDILASDVFTSDAIPTHLLTLEAFEEALSKVKDDGILLYHVSNRFLDLLPVLSCNAEKLHLHLLSHVSDENPYFQGFSAQWVVLSRNEDRLRTLQAGDRRWTRPKVAPICWTDDFSNLFSLLKISGL